MTDVAERTQEKYQVRFAWGPGGAARIAHGTHLLVWVDALPPTPTPQHSGARCRT